ncbi:heavy-metal-associated domain-containing protein [Geobacter pelophilus]|uniref:Heavy-metal-associated domain-containing protein n=1 Tax=Geoanaerobacter pelophilus TaxID=60036 RepID=A0AAW4L0L9_9BACT|nr:cation transporter [Geoanaerobacter pelophilus]MBT0664609.1 heavy-metal-associated domain-containing protein [Geoanaerobacter pelophilus]
MTQCAGKIFAILGATVALVLFGLVLQFDAAANAVAVFQIQGIESARSAAAVNKALSETGGISSVRIDPTKGIALAVFDARAVDPRSVAEAMNRRGFPCQIVDLMTMKEYKTLASGGAGCSTGGCGDCSKSK